MDSRYGVASTGMDWLYHSAWAGVPPRGRLAGLVAVRSASEGRRRPAGPRELGQIRGRRRGGGPRRRGCEPGPTRSRTRTAAC